MRPLRLLPFLLCLPLPGRAQEFVPPQEQAAGGTGSLRIGIFGFASRVGVDFAGTNQVIVSPTLDVADLFTNRLRLRPSAEIGLGDTVATYVINLELMYRFTADQEIAVPYIGFGGAVMSQERCATAVDCPRLWAQFALGFELKFREQINWLLEYHGEDGLRRHRFFIGLATRRGS
ncbi:MAG: hypothetical protein HYW52_01505 [Gemmatimonadetes bacterium]|nr:hypothetical protein [Gemmatimonadota bacterium]MBI2402465.1 hypothetical protein [Gemmatimonadota bacterium]MBI2614360.1 hypothetical protein [Gemmatimonadota bacterium]